MISPPIARRHPLAANMLLAIARWPLNRRPFASTHHAGRRQLLTGRVQVTEVNVQACVTNSVRACAGLDRAVIRLALTLDQGELAVLVRDNNPGALVAAQPAQTTRAGAAC